MNGMVRMKTQLVRGDSKFEIQRLSIIPTLKWLGQVNPWVLKIALGFWLVPGQRFHDAGLRVRPWGVGLKPARQIDPKHANFEF